MPAPARHLPDAAERLNRALARISDPEFEGAKAFTALYPDRARRDAEASDRRVAAGRALGPLDGRIVSVKALFDVEGEITHAGSALLRSRPPAAEDAVVVRRLREAGAVIVGRTQMTEFAFSALGTNPHDPEPGNPRDRARVPGGSSSGAVVSVVDGMAEIAIGSDTGGSVRIPAALSGAVGFKPTGGRVPTAGAFPLSSSLDTIGPIARSVRDCALADAVMAGEGEMLADPPACRLVVARGRLFDGVEPAVSRAFEAGLAQLRRHGLAAENGALDRVLDRVLDRLATLDSIGGLPSVELGATLRDLGIIDLSAVDPNTRVRIEAGANVRAIDYVRMLRRRAEAIDAFAADVAPGTILLLPTVPIVAPPLAAIRDGVAFQRVNGLVLRNPRIANLLDCPSISLPLPGSGLPVGLMLLGRRGSDRALLAVAARVEAALLPS